MKKCICIILSVILLFSVTSCNSYKQQVVSAEDVELHYNQCMDEIEEFLILNHIDNDGYSTYNEDGAGIGAYYFNDNNSVLSVYLKQHNNPLTDNFGEKCKVEYYRYLNDLNMILEIDKSDVQVISVALSCVTGETFTEYDVNLIMTAIEENLKYRFFSYGADETLVVEIIKYQGDYRGIDVTYSVSFNRTGTEIEYYESIAFDYIENRALFS